MHSQVAANLMTDEMLMRSAQLTPEYRPLVDFHAQYSTVQSQKVHLNSQKPLCNLSHIDSGMQCCVPQCEEPEGIAKPFAMFNASP